MTPFLNFLAYTFFTSQGLITYYLVDNFYPELKRYWIIYFILARFFIYLSEKKQNPLLNLKLWIKK